MPNIRYIDRQTKQEEQEKVYGHFFIQLLYGKNAGSRGVSSILLPLVAKVPFFSKLYGWVQKTALSKNKVQHFIRNYGIAAEEFLDPPQSFSSFNEFFIRKLKPEARPMAPGTDVAVLPADARYLAFDEISACDGFWVKEEKFSLEELLGSSSLAEKYKNGSMLIARLCPVDYHRFHFPCNCIPEKPRLINGPLYSVNPLALKHNIRILSQNKRVITSLLTKHFGTIQYIEVGATHVGSIQQTFSPGEPYAKGDEKGYFEFGGSCLILLFEPGKIAFDRDLIEHTQRGIEVRGLLGQSLGRALNP